MAELFFNDRRIDGRKTTELRKIDCFFLPGMADGSVLLQQGNTKVTASVFGPHPCKVRSDESPEQVYVTCRYNRPPFTSTSGNRQKQTSSDRVAAEYSITIEEIFSTLIRGSVYPMAQIDIFIEVLQSDGSEFSTAINAASLALATAGIEMVDFAVASTVGYYGSRLFADLCRYEENSRITQVTVVCLPASAAAKTDLAAVEDVTEVGGVPTDETLGARLLHTRLSSWLPSEKLFSLLRGGIQVAKVVHAELVFNLKKHVKSAER
uniref:Exosome complex component RRP41 n=3 Tax=Schistocephalus solidus TaxID=70667 RepID=A0A0X3PYB0_SCHSO